MKSVFDSFCHSAFCQAEEKIFHAEQEVCPNRLFRAASVVSFLRVECKKNINMSTKPLSERLAQFRQNFKQILGPKRQVR